MDLWIELLHALGHDPVAAAGFTLGTDFEGNQWRFFKYPAEDLRALFGIEVDEFNVWRPVLDHVEEQLGLGRLFTVEVDSWYLPDTAGISYRGARQDDDRPQRSTARPAPWLLPQRRLFDARAATTSTGSSLGRPVDPAVLPPYVETVRLDRLRRDDPDRWPRWSA